MLVVKGSVLDSIITEKYIGRLIISTAHFLLPQLRRFLLRYIGPRHMEEDKPPSGPCCTSRAANSCKLQVGAGGGRALLRKELQPFRELLWERLQLH
jgi:hypothetical protein